MTEMRCSLFVNLGKFLRLIVSQGRWGDVSGEMQLLDFVHLGSSYALASFSITNTPPTNIEFTGKPRDVEPDPEISAAVGGGA